MPGSVFQELIFAFFYVPNMFWALLSTFIFNLTDLTDSCMVLLVLSLDELRQEVRPVGLHQWRDLLCKYVHEVIVIFHSGE